MQLHTEQLDVPDVNDLALQYHQIKVSLQYLTLSSLYTWECLKLSVEVKSTSLKYSLLQMTNDVVILKREG